MSLELILTLAAYQQNTVTWIKFSYLWYYTDLQSLKLNSIKNIVQFCHYEGVLFKDGG